jgi:hypothetical protein
MQRLLMHWAPMGDITVGNVYPAQRVKCSSIACRVALETKLQQPGNSALAAANGAMQ